MTACHPQGRMGFSLDSLSYHSLLQLLKHCPPDDPLLEGESLRRIKARMAHLRRQPGGEAAHDAAVKAVGWEPESLQVATDVPEIRFGNIPT